MDTSIATKTIPQNIDNPVNIGCEDNKVSVKKSKLHKIRSFASKKIKKQQNQDLSSGAVCLIL